MAIRRLAECNIDALRDNVYPGRGIVIGQTPDSSKLLQVYWIMGRSENSRNRVFVEESGSVRTAPFDESKVEDASLIIYNCALARGKCHIVTNGDQTDTVVEGLRQGRSFEDSLYTRTFEPDAPNYTPRVSGIVDLAPGGHCYQLGILKTIDNNPDLPVRQIFSFGKPIAGVGHFIATYSGDGDPLPSFGGEPQPMVLCDSIDQTLDLFWSALNSDNKVSLMVKSIDIATGETSVRIANKHV